MEKLARAGSHAIFLLVGRQKQKTPFTISMIAKRHWHILDDIPFKCPELIDCHKELSPVQGETLDEYLRPAYRGGWNYLNNDLTHEVLGDGIVLDVNSLYPFCAFTYPLPWGECTTFTKEIPENIQHNDKFYYYVRFTCRFNLKENKLPFITIRDNWLYPHGESLATSDFIKKDGTRSSKFIDIDGELKNIEPVMCLSKTDFELFLEVYDVENLNILDGVYFSTVRSIFRGTIGEHYDGKLQAEKDGNRAKRRTHKMIMNALIGTLAKEKDHVSVINHFDEHGNLKQGTIKTTGNSASNIHIAAAILSYARAYIYRFALENKDRFLYTDTDSLHLLGKYIPKNINISGKLGDFKVEKEFKRAIYLKRKCYVLLDKGGHAMVTISGLTKEYREYLEVLLTACETPIKYNIIDFDVAIALHTAGIGEEIRGAITETERDERIFDYTGNEVFRPVRNEKYTNVRRFEQEIIHADSTEDRLRLLQHVPIPNGYREIDGWDNEIQMNWFRMYG